MVCHQGLCNTRGPRDTGWGAHIKGVSDDGNRAKNVVIKNNIFADQKERVIHLVGNRYNTDGSDSLPEFSGNLFVGKYNSIFGAIQMNNHRENGVKHQKYTLDIENYMKAHSDGTDRYWFLQ